MNVVDLFRRQRGVSVKNLREPEDGVQRGSDFVTHIREKGALCPIGSLRGLSGDTVGFRLFPFPNVSADHHAIAVFSQKSYGLRKLNGNERAAFRVNLQIEEGSAGRFLIVLE
ncbi:MAG: hypothetical protein BWX67_02229 [Thermotogae bacterium ADurb.Bin062]|nr:MAG: hypothetical protein BWX67_02229 [Thermotogota bacterium ADurb.Bin062]